VAEEKRYYYECRLLVNASEEEEPEPAPEEPEALETTRSEEVFDFVEMAEPAPSVPEAQEAAEPETPAISAPQHEEAPLYMDDALFDPDAEQEEQPEEESRMAKRPRWRLFGKRNHDEGM
jgi:hypothetical protein